MNKLLVLSLISALSFGTLTACSENEQQSPPKQQASAQSVAPVTQTQPASVPVSTQPQVVVVNNETKDEGLSTGEALLMGAAVGALTNSVTNNNTRDVHHYYTNDDRRYSSNNYVNTKSTALPTASSIKTPAVIPSVTKASPVVTPSYNKTLVSASASKTATLPSVSTVPTIKAPSAYTSSSQKVSAPTVSKSTGALTFDTNKTPTRSSYVRFKSSGSGFSKASSSSRRK